MVRLSKIPQISLHQDAKNLQRLNIRLAANGTVRIFPTALGGIFQVSTLQNALESTDYINYDKINKILTIGGDTTDSSGDSLETIIFDASERIHIGSAGDSKPDLTINSSTVSLEANELFEIIAQNIKIDSNTIFELYALDDMYIGRDASGTIMAMSLNFAAPIIDMSGASVTIYGDLNVNGDLYFEGSVQFMSEVIFNQRLVANDGAFINVMNNSNNATLNGIYMIDTGNPNFVIYGCDNSGTGPDNLPVHQSNLDGTTTRIRVGSNSGDGFIIETSSGELFTIDSSGTITIPGGIFMNNNIDVSGNANIAKNILFNGGSLDISGNLTLSGQLTAASLETDQCTIDISGNMNLNGNGYFINIETDTLNGNLAYFNSLTSDGAFIDGISGNITCSGDVIIENDLVVNGLLTIGVSTIDGSGNANFSGNARFTNIVSDNIQLDGIIIADNQIDCSGDINVFGNINVTEDCTIQGKLTANSFQSLDNLIDISGGNISATNSITTNTLNSSFIYISDNLLFNGVNGNITGVELLLSGILESNEFRTNNVKIDSSGITTNLLTVNEFNVINSDGIKTFDLDSSGNINANGYISVHGNIESINGDLIVGRDVNVNGTVYCNSIALPNIFFGNGISLTNEDFSGAILVKNSNDYTAIQPDFLVCGDASGNEIRITQNRIQIISNQEVSYFDFSGFKTNTVDAQNINITNNLIIGNDIQGGILNLNGNLITTNFTTTDGTVTMSSETDEVLAKSIETDALIMDSSGIFFKNNVISISDVFEIDSGNIKTTIDVSGLTIEDTSGNTTSLTSEKLETKILQADYVYATNVVLGDTFAFSDLSGGFYDDIFVSLSDLSGMTIKQFGPEYNVIVKIRNSVKTLLTLSVVVNFGTFFNDLSNSTVTGNLSDTHLQGPDRISKLIYDKTDFDITGYTYTRNGFEITISGDFTQYNKTFYDYYYTIGSGLGFDS